MKNYVNSCRDSAVSTSYFYRYKKIISINKMRLKPYKKQEKQ